MKKSFKIFAVVALVALVSVQSVWAGNDRRRGTAGASELLLNPWARSSGWGGVNVANARGIDAYFVNIAGLSFIEHMEFSYANSMLWGGKSGLNSGGTINSFGFGLRIFEKGVLGASITALGFGDIEQTTVNSPEPVNGTFSPNNMILNVSYAHSFTLSIHGGVNFKVVNESTDNVNASAFAIDAGIQYVSGANDELKFGISLKNWGPAFSFSGTGLSFQFVNDALNMMTAEYRAAELELPTCLNIGASYDFLFETWNQRLTLAAAFVSNAFLKDNFTVGMEYGLLDRVNLRCGYTYQTGVFDHQTATTAVGGLSAGASVIVPLSKKDSKNKSGVSLDYSYRQSVNLKGTHTIGATFKF